MTDASRAARDGAAEAPDPRFARAAIALAVLHALLGLLLYEPTLFPGGDNAGYMILGDALRAGEGYRDLYLPGSPLHAKYPPLFPALLAALGWVGGVQLFKLAVLACTSAAVWLTARVGGELAGEGPALLAAGLLAVNPTLLEYGHYVLSEAPFVALVLVALWGFARPSRRGAWIALAAAVAAFLTRSAGLTLLLALPVAWWLRGERRRATAAAAVAAVVLFGWGAYQAWAAPGQAGYLEELILRDPYDPAAGAVGVTGLVARAASNLWTYAGRVVPQTLFGPAADPGLLSVLLGMALAGLALWGWASRARRGPAFAELLLLLYVALIAIWPDVWTDRRFLLPVVPLVLLYAFGALGSTTGSIRRWAPVALLGLLALPAAGWIAERAPERMRCMAAYRAGRPCDLPPYASFYDAARWAGANTEADAIVVNRKPTLFYWYSRRQGDVYPYSPDPGVVLDAIERMGADYVVVDQLSGTTPRYLVPAIRSAPARFELVYEGGAPPTFIFRVHPGAANVE